MSTNLNFKQIPQNMIELIKSNQLFLDAFLSYEFVPGFYIENNEIKFNKNKYSLFPSGTNSKINSESSREKKVHILKSNLEKMLYHESVGFEIGIKEKYLELSKLFPNLNHSFTFDDIGILWGPLHYLLTRQKYGGEPPLCNVILGGRLIKMPECNVVYLDSSDVINALLAMQKITKNEIRRRFNYDEMIDMHIYGLARKSDFEILSKLYNIILRYYKYVASKRDGIIKYSSGLFQ